MLGGLPPRRSQDRTLRAMLDPGVITCSRCQQANWIPAGLERDDTTCTHCGASLLPGSPSLSTSTSSSSSASASNSASGAKPRRKRKRRPLVFLLSEPLAAATAAVAFTVIPGAPQFLPPVVNAWVPIPGPVVAARPSAVPVRTIVDDLPKQLPQQPQQATAVHPAAKKATPAAAADPRARAAGGVSRPLR